MKATPHEVFFQKTVDKNSKLTMAEFLAQHTKYRAVPYNHNVIFFTNNVKLPNLNLLAEIADNAYDIVMCEYDECEAPNPYAMYRTILSKEFTEKTGYKIAFAGRSNGYLIIAPKHNDYQKLNMVEAASMTIQEYMNMDTDHLREVAELVETFDLYCDKLRSALIYYATNYCVKESDGIYIERRRTKTMVPKEELTDNERLHVGDEVIHFKHELDTPENRDKYIYLIIGTGLHTETNEKMVIYANRCSGEIFVRPYNMFVSKVDKTKYPDIKQVYRLERIIEEV